MTQSNTVTLRATAGFLVKGRAPVKPGELVTLSRHEAQDVLLGDKAVIATEAEIAAAQAPPEPEPEPEPAPEEPEAPPAPRGRR